MSGREMYKKRFPLPRSPKGYTSNFGQNSPDKASQSLFQDVSNYVDDLRSKRQKLSTMLDIHHKSLTQELPIKCLVHENYITLYCQNDRKLLCVNCIYSSMAHKDHKVLPSRTTIAAIRRDAEDGIRQLDQEIARIMQTENNIKRNRRALQEQYKAATRQMDEEFSKILQLVKNRQLQQRKKIESAFAQAQRVNDLSHDEVAWRIATINRTRAEFPKSGESETGDLYRHLTLQLLNEEQTNVEKLTYMPTGQQIRNEFLSDVVELRETIERQIDNQPISGSKIF